MQITQEKFNELFVIINGIECKQPQRKPLKWGEEYFIADTSADGYFGKCIWDDHSSDNMWLERGLVYLKKEDAIKVTTALLMPLRTRIKENTMIITYTDKQFTLNVTDEQDFDHFGEDDFPAV